MALAATQLTSDDVDAALQADLVKTYRTTFSMKEFDLPLTLLQFEAFFGPVINLFAGDSTGRAVGISTNTTLTNAVDMPFLVRCIAIYIAVEPLGFTAAGAAIAAPAKGDPVPAFDGISLITGTKAAPVLTALTGTNGNHAWLEWGSCTWKAAHAFMQAYRLRMLLGGRLELFNELCADVGNLDSHSMWEGFSNSLSELPAYVAHVNAIERINLRELTFIPATAQIITAPGSQTALQVIGVPTPLVPASYGGPQQQGLFCGCYPTRGILLVPGMPINLAFVQDSGDSLYFAALRDALTESDEVKYDKNFSSNVATTGAGGGTVDNADFVEFKGGKLRIGIVMRGFELTPRAAIQWYGTYGGSFGQLYAVQSAAQMLTEYAMLAGIPNGLSGVPQWLAASAEDVAEEEGLSPSRSFVRPDGALVQAPSFLVSDVGFARGVVPCRSITCSSWTRSPRSTHASRWRCFAATRSSPRCTRSRSSSRAARRMCPSLRSSTLR